MTNINNNESIFRELKSINDSFNLQFNSINERIQSLNNNYHKLENYLVDDFSTNTPGLVNRLKMAEKKIADLEYKDKSRKERIMAISAIGVVLIRFLEWLFTVVIKKL